MQNIKVKYNIIDKDAYNFDKPVFIIGVILIGAVVTNQRDGISQNMFSQATKNRL